MPAHYPHTQQMQHFCPENRALHGHMNLFILTVVVKSQVGKAPSWARAPIGADSHDGFCIMHNIIFSADPKRAKMASRKLFLRDSLVAAHSKG